MTSPARPPYRLPARGHVVAVGTEDGDLDRLGDRMLKTFGGLSAIAHAIRRG